MLLEQALVPEVVLMYHLTVGRKQALWLPKLTPDQGLVFKVQLTADQVPKRMITNLRRPKILKVLKGVFSNK